MFSESIMLLLLLGHSTTLCYHACVAWHFAINLRYEVAYIIESFLWWRTSGIMVVLGRFGSGCRQWRQLTSWYWFYPELKCQWVKSWNSSPSSLSSLLWLDLRRASLPTGGILTRILCFPSQNHFCRKDHLPPIRPQNQHLKWLDFLTYQHHRKFDIGVGDSEGIVKLLVEERMSLG